MSFLQKFYTDLSEMDFETFEQAHKKHCSRGFLKCLKTRYKKAHGVKGYDWNLFFCNDSKKSMPDEFSYMNDRWKNLNEDCVTFMYGQDTVWVNRHKHCFYNEEDKWYCAHFGKQQVMVMIEGENAHVAITGLLNITRDIGFLTEHDR